MFIYKNLYDNMNNFLFPIYFSLLLMLNSSNYWYLVPVLFFLFSYSEQLLNKIINIVNSYITREKLIRLIKKYHKKIRSERIKETRNNIIQNISKDITNKVIEDSMHKLNFSEHKELMQKILDNVSQFKLFDNFFSVFKIIIIDYSQVDKEFLKELSEYCKINKKKLILISQNNPLVILKQLSNKYFNLENIVTPYHFNKSFFGSLYKVSNETINVNSECIKLSNLNLLNNIIRNDKSNECVFFGDNLAEKIDKKNIMAFNVYLNNKSFIDILENWLNLTEDSNSLEQI